MKRTLSHGRLVLLLALSALAFTLSMSFVQAQDTPGCEENFRPYTDTRGEVCVPENPQRIVAHFFASDMVALGLPMVGTNFNNASLVLLPEQLAGLTDIGVEPNVETVLGLNPDLIFVPDFTDAGIVDLLAEIAPTVVIPYSGDPFTRLRQFGDIVGKPEAAAAWIDAFDAKAAARREEVQPSIEPGETATAFIMYSDEQLYIYGRPRLGPIMYDVFGFTQPTTVTDLFQDDPDALWKSLSVELLPEYAGDRIFLIGVNDEDAKAATQSLVDGPIWQSLPAVQNGKVYYVDGRWAFNDPLTLNWLVDEMASTLLTQLSSTVCADGFHLFDHELLATEPVCIPDNPQRVVALDMSAIELLLLTNKEIVGAYDSFKDELLVLLPEFADQLSAIPNTGLPPNFELITQATPDVIVVNGGAEEYAAFSPIAPTVVLTGDTFTNDWKRTTEFWSEVFNVEDIYANMLATYNARVAELQQALGDDRGQIKVSLMTANPGWLSVWLRDSAQGKILQDVGLGRPESQDLSAEEAVAQLGSAGFETISEETLDLADGDVLFVFAYASSDSVISNEIDQNLEALQQNPIWQHLQVVQDEQVHIVGPYWYRGFTYLQANQILDDLFRYVAHVEPEAADPLAFLNE